MNEEKDRLGDFIRLLERGREGVYFAEKDRELIEKLKRRLQSVPQGRVDNPTMKCPKCDIHLQNSTLLDFPVSHCSGCGGIWLDPEVLPESIKLKAIQPLAQHSSTAESLRNVWPAGLRGTVGSLAVPRRVETKPTR